MKTVTAGVVIDVSVLDNKGQPVLDLGRDDFELTEDGKRQQIVSVSLVQGGLARSLGGAPPAVIAPPSAAAPRGATGAGSPSAVPAAAAGSTPSVTAILFDRLSPDVRPFAGRAALAYVSTLSPPHDYAGVFLADTTFKAFQSFTNQAESVRQGIVRVDRLSDQAAMLTPPRAFRTQRSHLGFFWLVIGLLAGVPRHASAQTPPHWYVEAGWAAGSRDSGQRLPPNYDQPQRSVIPAVMFGAGRQLQPWLGVEGSVQFQGAQSFPWRYSYQFDRNSEQFVKHRDVTILGYGRLSPCSGRRACIEPVIGGGVTRHYSNSFITADCGEGNLFQTFCTPVSPPIRSDTWNSVEWLFAAGVDVPIRVSSRVSLAPTVRVLDITRQQYLTGYSHRGPQNGSGVIVMGGMSAVWSTK